VIDLRPDDPANINTTPVGTYTQPIVIEVNLS